MSMSRRLCAIQRYISAFEYNYTGRTYVPLRRDKGMRHLVYSAKVLMRECLPIQCVEALFIGVQLTNGVEEVSLYWKILIQLKADANRFSFLVIYVQASSDPNKLQDHERKRKGMLPYYPWD